MNQRKTLISLIAAPAFFLFTSAGAEIWFSSQARSLAGPKSSAAVCSVSGPSRALQDLCDSRNLATFALSLSVGLLVLAVVAFGAVNVTNRWTKTGMIRFDTGCRFGYRASILTTVTLWIGSIGILFPMSWQLLIMRGLGLYSLDFDFFLIGAFLVAQVFGLFKLLRSRAPIATDAPITIPGRVLLPDHYPDLFAVLERITTAVNGSALANVLVGLEPGIFFTQRAVFVDGTLHQGGTLFLSLPFCRLMSEGEMVSVIAGEVIAGQLVMPGWVEWQAVTIEKYERIRTQFRNAPIESAACLFGLVWIWLDAWNNWQMTLRYLALQRAAVFGGRENTASGVVKTLLLASLA